MATTKTIDIRTAIPGPRSAAILERKERVIANAKTIAIPIVAQEGRGATLTDVDGNVFIDLTGGVGCLNVGHAHPRVLDAATEQMARFIHTDFTVVPYEPYVELAERLLALAPFRGPAKAAFFNAGTEAVENAVKFARLYTKRPAVIAFEGAFHGRTLLSMTLTSRPHPYPPYRTMRETRSGCRAAYATAIAAAWETPSSANRSRPTASTTVSRSPTHTSTDGSPMFVSESPQPRSS